MRIYVYLVYVALSALQGDKLIYCGLIYNDMEIELFLT